MNKKRLLSLLLALVLCVGLLPGTASAADSYTYGDLTYTVNNGEVTITDCNENATNVEIPAEIDGIPVTKIGDSAFSSCQMLGNVSIPNSVTYIDNWAFYYCMNLRNITLPNNITRIGEHAFAACLSLISIVIPDSVTAIGKRAFADCDELETITFSGNAPAIGSDCFGKISSSSSGVIAMAYYPKNNATWTAAVMQNYGGTITWVGLDSSESPSETPSGHTHCICGAEHKTIGNHTAEETITFEPWTSSTSLPSFGNYYLTEDVTLTSVAYLSGVKLCLNGHTITQNASDVAVIRSGSITLTDCQEVQGKITHASGKTGSGLAVTPYGTVSMYGGTIRNNRTGNNTGAGVHIESNAQSSSTFNLYGGSIISNTAQYIGDSNSVNDGAAGGGVYLDYYDTFNMYGGTISNNNANTDHIEASDGCGYGGGVYNLGGTFNMSGGVISDNYSNFVGGGVYSSGTFNMSGNAVIQNNTALYYGAGVYHSQGTFTMESGKIKNNCGEGVHIWGGAGSTVDKSTVFYMKGGTISDNYEDLADLIYSDGVNNENGVVEMSGGCIKDNKDGSGIVNHGIVTLKAGTITGNGVGIHNYGIVTMIGGTISENKTGLSSFTVAGSSKQVQTTIGGTAIIDENTVNVDTFHEYSDTLYLIVVQEGFTGCVGVTSKAPTEGSPTVFSEGSAAYKDCFFSDNEDYEVDAYNGD